MSKLLTGTVKCTSLSIVRQACTELGWPCIANDTGIRIDVRRGGANFRPYIDAALVDGQVQLTYDHWMSYARRDEQNNSTMEPVEQDDMDATTRKIVGKLKQGIAKVQIEHLLAKQKASWRVEQRQDGAQVFVIRR